MTDVDIDLADRAQALEALPCVDAVLTGERRRHPTGVYFQRIPVDPVDGMAVWDYAEAGQKGYFKVDLLPNTIYKQVRDEHHLVDLLITDPPWAAFEDPEIVAGLAQIRNHYHIIRKIKPRSIEDLAVCIALFRPGKTHLIGRPRDEIDRELWLPTASGGYAFKRSHAIAYAASIVVQLNLLYGSV